MSIVRSAPHWSNENIAGIRPFTVGRKNWLFADTPKGANASAAVYSIVETAKQMVLIIYLLREFITLHA